MAELNWIVPARRAVVAQPGAEEAYESRSRASSDGPPTLSYEEVLGEWIHSLAEHRDTLLSWYAPLDDRGRSAENLGPAFDRLLQRASEWRPGRRGLHPVRSSSVRASTGASGNTASPVERGLHVRLWKGPLRVLSEHQHEEGALASFQNAMGNVERTITVGEGRHASEVVLQQNNFGEVWNADAAFLPGDVIEFPLFTIWSLLGMALYDGARFNPQGSFLLGTSVLGPGGSPGDAWLHDNMLAMRFQLILNAAIGSHYSLDPQKPFAPGSRLRRCNRAALLGKQIYARGMIYGGAHRNPASGRLGGDRFCFQELQWGVGMNVPHHDAVVSMQRAGCERLTGGWSCNPSSLTLAYYMLDLPEGWQRGGSPNSHAALFPEDDPLVRTSDHDYFAPRMLFGPRSDRASTTQQVAVRSGLADISSVNDLQTMAIIRLVGERIQADDEEHEIPAERIMDYARGKLSTIALNGHVYSWVFLTRPDRLMSEPTDRYEMTAQYDPTQPGSPPVGRPPQGPPVAGFISAYNPLTGSSYAVEPHGELFVFDTSGSFRQSKFRDERFGVTTFTAGPSRWVKAGPFYIKRLRSGEVKIGDGAGGRLRSKPLVSIVQYHPMSLQRAYSRRRAFRKITFHRPGDRLPNGDQEIDADVVVSREWYGFRASPFSTLTEANRDSRYPLLSDVLDNLRELRTGGNSRPHRTLKDLTSYTAGRLTTAGEQEVRNRISDFDERVQGEVEEQSRDARVARLESEIRRLERRLAGRSEADLQRAADAQEQELRELAPDPERLRQLEELEEQARTAQRRRQEHRSRGEFQQAAPYFREWQRVKPQADRLRAQLEPVLARIRQRRRTMYELHLREAREELEQLERREPDMDAIRTRVERGIYRPYAEQSQKILHDMGDSRMPHDFD